jgi:hypothetical protein
MTKTIYFDESGFTGYNYLDPLQPIFTLASHDITPDLSEKILKISFPNYKGDEFKFSNLWKSNRNQFLDFANNLKAYGNGIKFWVIDKRFAVIVKMVDFLVEPSITNAGFNFLANGFGRKFANYVQFGLTHFGTKGSAEELIFAYQAFSRNPSSESLTEFTKRIKEITAKQTPELQSVLEQMVEGAVNFETYSNLDTFKSTNDLQFTAMLAAVADWQREYTGDKVIIHDASSNFLRQKEVWDQVTGNDVDEHLHPLGDGTFVQFPLRVLATHAVDSKSHYSVQLSDLLSGYAAKHFNLERPDQEREVLDGMVDAGLFNSSFNGIRPGYEFPSENPEKLNGPDAVDLMIKMMNGK